MAGKGDQPRKVDRSKFENNWDKIFGGRMTMSEPNATRIKEFFQHEENADGTTYRPKEFYKAHSGEDKDNYFHHDYEDTSTPREVLDTVDTDNAWAPRAMSQVQIDRKLKEWGIMYQLLMNMHGYEDPVREAKAVLKQIKI